MKWSIAIALLVVIVLAGAAGVYADVVTITPSNPGDWSWAWNASDSREHAYFTKGGPAPAEGNPIPTDNGAFYAWLDWDGADYVSTPASAWLGLDKFHGVSLSTIKVRQIMRLEYTAYVSGNYNQNQGSSINKKRYPGQPFMVSYTVQDRVGNARCLWYEPWGHPLGWAYWNNRRAWLNIDAINMSSDPNFAAGAPNPQWYNWWFNNGSSNIYLYDSYAQMCDYRNSETASYLGDLMFMPTSTTYDPANNQWKSAGWDNSTVPIGDARRSTATGKPLNLWIGARKASLTELGSWNTETMNFSGYVDTVTLGIDLDNNGTLDDTETTTFDFASDDPAPKHVAVADVGKSRWAENPPVAFPYAVYRATMNNHFSRGQNNQHQFTYRWFGQVQDLITTGGGPARDDIDTREFFFTIWDGSYTPVPLSIDPTGRAKGTVEVRLPWQDSQFIDNFNESTWPVHVGDYVAVDGWLYDRFYRVGDPAPPPAEVTGKDVTVYHTDFLPF